MLSAVWERRDPRTKNNNWRIAELAEGLMVMIHTKGYYAGGVGHSGRCGESDDEGSQYRVGCSHTEGHEMAAPSHWRRVYDKCT